MKIETLTTESRVRKIFSDVPDVYKDFTPNCKVLSAEMETANDSTPVFFVKKHEPGEKGWKEGGYECSTISNQFRAFHLDALIVHPDELSKRIRNQYRLVKEGETPLIEPTLADLQIENTVPVKRRGRPRTKPVVIKDPNAPKGKRGRPAMSAEEKQRRIDLGLTKVVDPNKPKGKRGRPKLDPALLKPKKEYVPKGNGKRGRPPMSEEEKQKRIAAGLLKIKDPNAPKRGRGRPAKQQINQLFQKLAAL